MVAALQEGALDLAGMRHFQDVDLRMAMMACLVDSIQDGLQLALVV
jgi:hypothetical protein